jgi:glyoxylase-like metal-dependent hydrolase (beta-lactamase superfamily II)
MAMGTKNVMICEIARNTYAINEYGLSTMYLLVGSKRALLIDTGVGICDLKSEIMKLTDKPIDAALGHGHLDHAGGMFSFDQVYIHPADRNEAVNLDWKALRNYIRYMLLMGSNKIYNVSSRDLRIIKKPPEILDLSDGQIFDLGDRKVEIIETPGHTLGSVVFLDHSERILFSSDACNINYLLMAASVTTALRGFDKIKLREQEFDRNFNGHVGYFGSLNCCAMPGSTLDDCIKICEDILSGTADIQSSGVTGIFPKTAYVKYGSVKVSFDPKRFLDEGEAPVR